MLAIENPSTAVENVSGIPNRQGKSTHRFAGRIATGDRSVGNNRHASDGIPIAFRSSQP